MFPINIPLDVFIRFLTLLFSGILLGHLSEYLFKKFWKKKRIEETLKNYEFPYQIFNIKMDDIIAFLIKFSILLVFLVEALGVANLTEIQKFCLGILYFIPNLLRIIIVAYIGEFIIEKTKKVSEDIPYGHVFYLFISFIMFLFIGGIVLKEIGVSDASILLRIVEIIMWGISFGIAITLGIIGYIYFKGYIEREK